MNNCFPINSGLLVNYFRNLVNQFFKILPMRENDEPSLKVFMQSLQQELIGCKGLIPELQEDALFLTLLAILQVMIDDEPKLSVSDTKRNVFKAISICNKLKAVYAERGLSST